MDELIKKAALRAGLPEEQMKLIVEDYWRAIKAHIYEPHTMYCGIKLGNFIRIDLSYWDLQKILLKTATAKDQRSVMRHTYWKGVVKEMEERKPILKRNMQRGKYGKAWEKVNRRLSPPEDDYYEDEED